MIYIKHTKNLKEGKNMKQKSKTINIRITAEEEKLLEVLSGYYDKTKTEILKETFKNKVFIIMKAKNCSYSDAINHYIDEMGGENDGR